jgi:YidC/Oxa1 family membrane protein insertase
LNNEEIRRLTLAAALIMGLMVIWQLLFPPPIEPEAALTAGPAPVAEGAPAPAAIGGAAPAPAPAAAQIAPHAVPLPVQKVVSEVASANGALRGLALDTHHEPVVPQPIWTWAWGKVTGAISGGWEPWSGGEDAHHVLGAAGLLGIAGGGPTLTDGGAATPDGPSAYEVRDEGGVIVARGVESGGLRVEKRFTPGATPHVGELVVTFENTGSAPIPSLWVGVADQPSGPAPGMFNQANNIVHPAAYVDGSLESTLSAEDLGGAELESFDGTVSWVGMGDRYFLAALMPDELAARRVVFDALPSGRWGAFYVDDQPLDPGASRALRFRFFVGPKDLSLLGVQAADLDEAVEYGIFGLFAIGLLWVLKIFHMGVGNWGVSIVLLTLLVKLVFYRLNEKAYESSEKMKLVQPELAAIKELYPDDQARQSQETMKLWSKYGVSPLGGCLPMLIQMPIFFALYNVMYYSVELYGTDFLHLRDLTAADPTGVIPTIYAILLIVQQQMTPMANLDPAQQKMMKAMPFIFAFMMFSFPSGLVLYWCVNIFLTIAQQWIIRKKLQRKPPTLAVASPPA